MHHPVSLWTIFYDYKHAKPIAHLKQKHFDRIELWRCRSPLCFKKYGILPTNTPSQNTFLCKLPFSKTYLLYTQPENQKQVYVIEK